MSNLKEAQKELREKITTELAPKAIVLLETAMEASLDSGKTTDMVKAADAVLAYANLTKNKDEAALQVGASIATASIVTALKGLANVVGIEADIPEVIYQPEAELIEHEVEEHVHEKTISTIHALEEIEPEEENNDWSYIDE